MGDQRPQAVHFNGYDASLYVVYANTNPKARMLQGTSSFLVARDTPALTVTLWNMVKLVASEEILKVAQHCLELHGGNGVMLDFGVEKIFRDAAIFLHMDATVDISKLKIVKSMFPATAGTYAGPE